MNSRSILTFGCWALAFFWVVTPAHSQYFVPDQTSGDPTLEAKLQLAYEQVYGAQPTEALRNSLSQAQNSWQAYRVSEAMWESGTQDTKSPAFQKAISEITALRITQLNGMINIHPATAQGWDSVPEKTPVPATVQTVIGQRIPNTEINRDDTAPRINGRIMNNVIERYPRNPGVNGQYQPVPTVSPDESQQTTSPAPSRPGTVYYQ